MTIAYFDCFSGICGDMILGALFDLGLDQNFFLNEINKLNINGYSIEVKKLKKNHISATDVYIEVKEKQHHRSYSDISELINKSSLSDDIKAKSINIFHKLAVVESRIHQININEVHFHEIGAVDSIIDIVGSVIGLKYLEIEKVFSSKLPLGKGFVNCLHGIIPIPAPATLELLKDIPVYQTETNHEMITPTGAAIITSIAFVFGEMPPMKIKKIGYGAGKIKSEYPSLLRIILGDLDI